MTSSPKPGDLIKRMREGRATPEDIEYAATLSQKKHLTPEESAIAQALMQCAWEMVETREKEDVGRKKEIRSMTLTRIVYFVVVTTLLAGFAWLNVVSSRIDWGISAARTVAMKWKTQVCEHRRCTNHGNFERNYTLIGLGKDTHYFCKQHVIEAPDQIGQSGTVALLSGSLFTLAAVAFYAYSFCRVVVGLAKWDAREPPREIVVFLLASCALYIVPTIYSYLIGV